MKALYYSPALTFGILAILGFQGMVPWWSVLALSFILIPILELILKPNPMRVVDKHHWSFDLLLYMIVGIQIYALISFMELTKQAETAWIYMFPMGLLCGVYGINVAHELGHRKEMHHQWAAQLLLLTSLYMHFFIEHNRGHHKRVGTADDPATAPKGQSLYRFWIQSIVFSFISAYQLEAQRLKREGSSLWSLKNQFLRFQLIQLVLLAIMYIMYGMESTLYFVGSAVIGILLLETINYIEHYGLYRSKFETGVHERVNAQHSWNSDHPLGRYILFELTRHSDHHLNSSKAYPTLASQSESPYLPTGYPGMMILSFISPLWFKVMDKRLPR